MNKFLSLILIFLSQSLWSQEGLEKPLIEDVKIAFVSYRTGSAEVFLMNSDGTEVEQITNSEENNSFPRQIDKRTLEFTRRDSLGKAEKYQIDIYTKEERPFIEDPVVEGAKWEAESPNGRYVAFVRSTDYRDRELFLLDTKSGEEKRLTSHKDESAAAYSINHSWSRDGKKLVFMSGPDWYNQFIRIYDVETDSISVVTDRGYMNSGLLWLKDNKTLIANLKIRDKTLYELYSVDVATGEVKQITENINLHPNISPDGDWIVFESQRHQNDGEVYIMKPDGSNQVRLTNNPNYNGRCIWFKLR